MDTTCNRKESVYASPVVFQITGEPAIGIHGVPDVSPGGGELIQLETVSDADSDSDPCFGEWLVERKVKKIFGNQYYSGKVVKFDKKMKWYRVVYEDGDFEDLEWHELEEVMLPLDISISLKELASQICKCGNSVIKSGDKRIKPRKYGTRKVESSKRTLELVPAAQITESKNRNPKNTNTKGKKVKRLMRAKVDCERIALETLNRQRKIRSAKVTESEFEILMLHNVHIQVTAERLMEAPANFGRTELETLERQRNSDKVKKRNSLC